MQDLLKELKEFLHDRGYNLVVPGDARERETLLSVTLVKRKTENSR